MGLFQGNGKIAKVVNNFVRTVSFRRGSAKASLRQFGGEPNKSLAVAVSSLKICGEEAIQRDAKLELVVEEEESGDVVVKFTLLPLSQGKNITLGEIETTPAGLKFILIACRNVHSLKFVEKGHGGGYAENNVQTTLLEYLVRGAPPLSMQSVQKLEWARRAKIVNLAMVLAAFPELSYVYISWSNAPMFQHIKRWGGRKFPKLRHLNISGSPWMHDSHFELLSSWDLHLDTLAIYGIPEKEGDDLEGMCNFVASTAATLLRLNIRVNCYNLRAPFPPVSFPMKHEEASPAGPAFPNLKRFTSSGMTFKNLEFLGEMPMLKFLAICSTDPYSWETMATSFRKCCTPIQHLKHINIGLCSGQSMPMLVSSILGSIKVLTLADNLLGDYGFTIICSLSQLEELVMYAEPTTMMAEKFCEIITDSSLTGLSPAELAELASFATGSMSRKKLKKQKKKMERRRKRKCQYLCGMEKNILNLTCLRRLCTKYTRHLVISEISIFYGIFHLKNLKILTLPANCELTDGAWAELRKRKYEILEQCDYTGYIHNLNNNA